MSQKVYWYIYQYWKSKQNTWMLWRFCREIWDHLYRLKVIGCECSGQGKLLARACDYAAAAEVFQKVLESSPDDWESFIHYLDCLLEDNSRWSTGNVVDFKARRRSHLVDGEFDSRMESASCFVQKLQLNSESQNTKGLILANLEIERRQCIYGKVSDGNKLVETLLEFFSRFGHLASFTSDVEMYVQILTPDEKKKLFGEMMKVYASSASSPLNKLGQAISIYKAQALFGSMYKLSVQELEVFATQMVEKYFESLPFSRDLDPQENMHGEELLCLACNVLVMLYFQTRELGYLVEAVMVPEFGLTIRRFIWQYKILLVHLYSHLGALPSAYEWYLTLDIKNILLETSSHHILPEMLRSPLWSNLSDLLNDYLKFMEDHLKEAADLTFLAYRHRNYTKVIEFVEFKERLQHSHQLFVASIEAPILQLKQKANNLHETESLFASLDYGPETFELNEERFKYMTFNEDVESRPWWSPASYKNFLLDPPKDSSHDLDLCLKEKINKAKIEDEKREASSRKAVERRSLVPRLIYLSIQSASSLKESVESNGPTSTIKSKSELNYLLERYAKNLGFTFHEAIKMIVDVSEGNKFFKDLGSEAVDWIQFAVFVNAWNLSRHDQVSVAGDVCGLNSWFLVDELMEKFVAEELGSAQPLTTCAGGTISALTQIVSEPLSWHVLVIQSCIRSLKPTGKKKKKSVTVDQSHAPVLQAINCSIQTLTSVLEKVQRWLREQIDTSEDGKMDTLLLSLHIRDSDKSGPGRVLQVLEAATLSTSKSEVGDRIHDSLQSWSRVNVARKIINGQVKVLTEFHNICFSKLKLLGTLKQLI
ncbi:N-terminal acetyltransferase B complex auxiliary subunit NAA25 isoform X2 [Aristolochia californica]|uniref:N-terminal acetyltransferase B complex auxiliary subunit NAA25 isoform X2 n=1 Tax=Aristolochia californica TaxID=171875 RepID=UPI0035DB7220